MSRRSATTTITPRAKPSVDFYEGTGNRPAFIALDFDGARVSMMAFEGGQVVLSTIEDQRSTAHVHLSIEHAEAILAELGEKIAAARALASAQPWSVAEVLQREG